MRITRYAVAATLVMVFFLSYRPPVSESKDFAPVKDFGWLAPVKMLSECLTMEHYEKTKGKSFDSAGVAMTNGKYHPVNLFQYGILAFDLYRSTGEEHYRQKCVAQFRYFLDTAQYTTTATGAIGFPYHISFRDLKPVWYSGLAQAEGVMYLIRYYVLTRDKRALPLIHKVREFMLTPVDSGGTLNVISETECWIEEYVGSTKKPQVINGFATAIIGLYEYCKMFPGDSRSKNILNKCLHTHKTWLHKFDAGDGIIYDLGERSKVNPWYSKFQVVQMKQMHEIFKDAFYHDIEMLWATYAYDKRVTNVTGCLLNDTNYSVPARSDAVGWFVPSRNMVHVTGTGDVIKVMLPEKMPAVNASNLADGNEATVFVVRNSDSVAQPPFVHLILRKAVTADALLMYTVLDALDYSGYVMLAREKHDGEWVELPFSSLAHSGKKYYFGFDESTLSEFKIVFSIMNKATSLGIYELSLLNSRKGGQAHLSHALSKQMELKDTLVKFEFDKRDVNDYVVFYKTSRARGELPRAKWKVYEAIHDTKFEISTRDQWCQFLVIFKNESPKSAVSEIVMVDP